MCRLFPDDMIAYAPTKQVLDKIDAIFTPGSCNLPGAERPCSLGLPYGDVVALTECIQKLEVTTAIGKVLNNKRSLMIDIDLALTELLAQFNDAREHHFEYLEALYLAGDINGDGEMAPAEFEMMLKLLDADITKYAVLNLYRECQELTAKGNRAAALLETTKHDTTIGSNTAVRVETIISPEAFSYTIFTRPNFRIEPLLHSVPSKNDAARSLLKKQGGEGERGTGTGPPHEIVMDKNVNMKKAVDELLKHPR
jgi:hypothetical protein